MLRRRAARVRHNAGRTCSAGVRSNWVTLWKQYPELEHFEREDVPGVASEALTFAKHEVTRTWRFWLTAVALLVAYVAVMILAGRMMTQYFGSPDWARYVGSGCCGVVFSGVVWRLFRDRTRRHLREKLVQLGIPICLPCGYDLRGSTDRCPECGTTFEVVAK